MILGLGVDVCPVDRIDGVVERHGDLFLKRVFTEAELEYAGDNRVTTERLAARWAAKEATIKALRDTKDLNWTDMEVLREEDGAPRLVLHGTAKKRADEMGVTRTLRTLTHAGGIAVAVVIMEGNQ